MRTPKATTTLMILGLAFAVSTTRATVIVSDNFNNAVMNNGVLESTLNYGPATATGSQTLGIGALDGSALHLGGASGSIYITAALPQSISLENVGDFVQMTFDFTTSGGNRGNRVLRYGFFQGAEVDADATGYFLAGYNQANSAGDDMNSRLVVDTTDINKFYTQDTPTGGTGNIGSNLLLDDVSNQAIFRVERIDVDTMRISGIHGPRDLGFFDHTIDENTATSVDEIWFGIRNRDTNFTIDNLQITAIPEPSTLFLVGSVLLGFLLVNKTRRR